MLIVSQCKGERKGRAKEEEDCGRYRDCGSAGGDDANAGQNRRSSRGRSGRGSQSRWMVYDIRRRICNCRWTVYDIQTVCRNIGVGRKVWGSSSLRLLGMQRVGSLHKYSRMYGVFVSTNRGFEETFKAKMLSSIAQMILGKRHIPVITMHVPAGSESLKARLR